MVFGVAMTEEEKKISNTQIMNNNESTLCSITTATIRTNREKSKPHAHSFHICICIHIWWTLNRFPFCYLRRHWFVPFLLVSGLARPSFSSETNDNKKSVTHTHTSNGLSQNISGHWHWLIYDRGAYKNTTISSNQLCYDHTPNVLNNVISNTHHNGRKSHNGKLWTESFSNVLFFFPTL